MSSRCICCNEIMEVFELKKKKPNGDFEDTCTSCLFDINYYENTTESAKFYQCEDGRTGLRVPNLDYFDKI